MNYKSLLLCAFLFFAFTKINAQKIYRDIAMSKQAITNSNYEKLMLPIPGKDEFDFAYFTDGKYGQEMVYYYVDANDMVYKVVYIPISPKQAFLRMVDLQKVLPAEQFMTSRTTGTLSRSVYGLNTSYYEGWAFFKWGDYLVEGKILHCFVVYLDRRPE
jgi:hypothetical protein